MSTPKIVLTTVLTTLTALAFAVVFGVSLLPAGAIAHGGWQSGNNHKASFGGHFGRHGGGNLSNRCERMSEQHTRLAGAVATAYLDLDDAQESALQPMLQVMDSWRNDGQALCFELANSDSHTVATGMQLLERLLSRSAEAVAELQPAYASFEATLSIEQREKIQSGIDRHHGRTEG